MSLILAIDQGTTNTKALLVDGEGKVVHRASSPLRVLHPQADFVEQDPVAILRSVDEVVADCVAVGEAIAAVAISNQRETVMAWDRQTGAAIDNAMTWQCRRAASICDSLRAKGLDGFLRERTGLGIDPLFSAAKLAWLLKNTPGLRERAEAGEICVGTMDSWVMFHLTGGSVHATDHSNAARTQMLNIHTLQWDDELLALFGVPKVALPKLHPSSGRFGECAVEGLNNVPLMAALGDSHAALAGYGSSAPGTVKATYGTGSSLMTLTGSAAAAADSHLSQTIGWTTAAATHYALEGNISMTGSAVQWLGEFLGLANPVADAVALAASVNDSAGVYFVPAMSGLGAPHWDSDARGTITGLSRTSTRAHLARAAVEAIAFQVRDVFAAMESEAGVRLPALHADGGATRNDALMQFQADVLGRPVLRSATEDLSALGAAKLAGVALGWWPSLDALPCATTGFEPTMPELERNAKYGAWRHAVAQARLKPEVTA